MKQKLIIIVFLFLVLIGLIFVINKGKKSREINRNEENLRVEQEQQKIDSLANLKRLEEIFNNQTKIEKDKSDISKTTSIEHSKSIGKVEVDFNSFLNHSYINTDNIDINVTIIDKNKNYLSSISSSVSDIYLSKKYKANIGLLRNSLITSQYFNELNDGNSDIIDKLNLCKYVDYIIIGKLSSFFDKGNLVEGTIICRATLKINIITACENKIYRSFSISVNSNGTNEDQAYEYAIDKLLREYKTNYSTL